MIIIVPPAQISIFYRFLTFRNSKMQLAHFGNNILNEALKTLSTCGNANINTEKIICWSLEHF